MNADCTPTSESVLRIATFMGKLDYLLRETLRYMQDFPCPCGMQSFADQVEKLRQEAHDEFNRLEARSS